MQLRRYIWESSADGNFAISEDTENEPLGRGTDIRIHLKESAAEYATEEKLRVCIVFTSFHTPGSETDTVTYCKFQFKLLFDSVI
jgi:HSP90 family molecular chaperone